MFCVRLLVLLLGLRISVSVVVSKSSLLSEHKLLSTGPTEPWSIREKLCLASSVMRSGDQNW